MKYVSILGSTGSIGTQTLDVIKQHPDQFKAVALVAHRNIDLLEQQRLVSLEELSKASWRLDSLRVIVTNKE